MTDLHTAIEQVRKRIASHKGPRSLNEQNTKAALIEPVLRALGWNVEDPDEVSREYKSKARDRPVDYALLDMRSPRLFVEAKALGLDLADRKWAGQIIGYAAVAGVKWAVLTDGSEYRIYNTHAPVDVEKKLFRRLSLVDDGQEYVLETLRLLSRGEMEKNRIDALWSMHFVDQAVGKALGEVFGGEPDESLVRLLKKHTTGITSTETQASLQRLRVDFDFPVPALTADVQPARLRKKSRRTKGGEQASARTAQGKVSLVELIKSGALRAPLEIETKYKGTHLQARIEDDGTITMDGASHSSLSHAGGAARMRVLGTDVAPATNGWSFWRYRKKDGTLERLSELRDRATG